MNQHRLDVKNRAYNQHVVKSNLTNLEILAYKKYKLIQGFLEICFIAKYSHITLNKSRDINKLCYITFYYCYFK